MSILEVVRVHLSEAVMHISAARISSNKNNITNCENFILVTNWDLEILINTPSTLNIDTKNDALEKSSSGFKYGVHVGYPC